MITLESPASAANLGAGYDVFGLALNGPRDKMRFEETNRTEIKLRGEYRDIVPSDIEENSAGVVAKKLINDFGVSEGVEVVIEKNIRPCSGLGSSAASSAGAAVGINELFNLGLTKEELLWYSAFGEEVAAGTKHYDNIAPLIYGDLCAVDPYKKEVLEIGSPKFNFLITLPNTSMNTEEAREVVPKEVNLEDVKRNIFYASSLITGAIKNDKELFGRGLRDEIITPKRTKNNDVFKLVKEVVSEAEGYGLALSGSGPAMISVAENPDELGEEVKERLMERGFESEVFVTGSSQGIEVL